MTEIKLQAGNPAPDFLLVDQDGNNVKLADFKGKKVLLYFYPKALTPGCTTQSCALRDASGELAEKNTVVIGVSPDQPEKQKKFDDKHELGFPLLSDPEHATAEAYGVWGLKKMCGREYMGIVRSSFLIDENGVITESWYKVSPKKTVPSALKAL